MSGFWNAWPSWLVELLSGALACLPGALWVQWIRHEHHYVKANECALRVFTLAMCLSFIYERWLDPNGMSWPDFAQRALGIILGTAVAFAIWRLEEWRDDK